MWWFPTRHRQRAAPAAPPTEKVWRIAQVGDLPKPPDDFYDRAGDRPVVPLAPVCAFVVQSMRTLASQPLHDLRAVEQEFDQLLEQEDFGAASYRQAWLELLPEVPHDAQLLKHVARTLVNEPIQPLPASSAFPYHNGTHRVLAMRAHHVRETVVLDRVPQGTAAGDDVLELPTDYLG